MGRSKRLLLEIAPENERVNYSYNNSVYQIRTGHQKQRRTCRQMGLGLILRRRARGQNPNDSEGRIVVSSVSSQRPCHQRASRSTSRGSRRSMVIGGASTTSNQPSGTRQNDVSHDHRDTEKYYSRQSSYADVIHDETEDDSLYQQDENEIIIGESSTRGNAVLYAPSRSKRSEHRQSRRLGNNNQPVRTFKIRRLRENGKEDNTSLYCLSTHRADDDEEDVTSHLLPQTRVIKTNHPSERNIAAFAPCYQAQKSHSQLDAHEEFQNSRGSTSSLADEGYVTFDHNGVYDSHGKSFARQHSSFRVVSSDSEGMLLHQTECPSDDEAGYYYLPDDVVEVEDTLDQRDHRQDAVVSNSKTGYQGLVHQSSQTESNTVLLHPVYQYVNDEPETLDQHLMEEAHVSSYDLAEGDDQGVKSAESYQRLYTSVSPSDSVEMVINRSHYDVSETSCPPYSDRVFSDGSAYHIQYEEDISPSRQSCGCQTPNSDRKVEVFDPDAWNELYQKPSRVDQGTMTNTKCEHPVRGNVVVSPTGPISDLHIAKNGESKRASGSIRSSTSYRLQDKSRPSTQNNQKRTTRDIRLTEAYKRDTAAHFQGQAKEQYVKYVNLSDAKESYNNPKIYRCKLNIGLPESNGTELNKDNTPSYGSCFPVTKSSHNRLGATSLNSLGESIDYRKCDQLNMESHQKIPQEIKVGTSRNGRYRRGDIMAKNNGYQSRLSSVNLVSPQKSAECLECDEFTFQVPQKHLSKTYVRKQSGLRNGRHCRGELLCRTQSSDTGFAEINLVSLENSADIINGEDGDEFILRSPTEGQHEAHATRSIRSVNGGDFQGIFLEKSNDSQNRSNSMDLAFGELMDNSTCKYEDSAMRIQRDRKNETQEAKSSGSLNEFATRTNMERESEVYEVNTSGSMNRNSSRGECVTTTRIRHPEWNAVDCPAHIHQLMIPSGYQGTRARKGNISGSRNNDCDCFQEFTLHQTCPRHKGSSVNLVSGLPSPYVRMVLLPPDTCDGPCLCQCHCLSSEGNLENPIVEMDQAPCPCQQYVCHDIRREELKQVTCFQPCPCYPKNSTEMRNHPSCFSSAGPQDVYCNQPCPLHGVLPQNTHDTARRESKPPCWPCPSFCCPQKITHAKGCQFGVCSNGPGNESQEILASEIHPDWPCQQLCKPSEDKHDTCTAKEDLKQVLWLSCQPPKCMDAKECQTSFRSSQNESEKQESLANSLYLNPQCPPPESWVCPPSCPPKSTDVKECQTSFHSSKTGSEKQEVMSYDIYSGQKPSLETRTSLGYDPPKSTDMNEGQANFLPSEHESEKEEVMSNNMYLSRQSSQQRRSLLENWNCACPPKSTEMKECQTSFQSPEHESQNQEVLSNDMYSDHLNPQQHRLSQVSQGCPSPYPLKNTEMKEGQPSCPSSKRGSQMHEALSDKLYPLPQFLPPRKHEAFSSPRNTETKGSFMSSRRGSKRQEILSNDRHREQQQDKTSQEFRNGPFPPKSTDTKECQTSFSCDRGESKGQEVISNYDQGRPSSRQHTLSQEPVPFPSPYPRKSTEGKEHHTTFRSSQYKGDVKFEDFKRGTSCPQSVTSRSFFKSRGLRPCVETSSCTKYQCKKEEMPPTDIYLNECLDSEYSCSSGDANSKFAVYVCDTDAKAPSGNAVCPPTNPCDPGVNRVCRNVRPFQKFMSSPCKKCVPEEHLKTCQREHGRRFFPCRCSPCPRKMPMYCPELRECEDIVSRVCRLLCKMFLSIFRIPELVSQIPRPLGRLVLHALRWMFIAFLFGVAYFILLIYTNLNMLAYISIALADILLLLLLIYRPRNLLADCWAM